MLQLTAMASLNSIVLGYEVGVMGGAMIYIRDEMKLIDMQVEFFFGILNIFAIFGAGCSGIISDKYGRTKTLLVGSLTIFVGNLAMATSTSFPLLFVTFYFPMDVFHNYVNK